MTFADRNDARRAPSGCNFAACRAVFSRMRARFHLLLCFSLLFNAIAAPWAMAHPAAHDDVAQHPLSHSSKSSMEHPDAGGATPDTHQHHHSNAATSIVALSADAGDTLGEPPDHSDCASSSNCCDGPLCLCGCMMPPVLSTIMFPALPRGVPTAIFDATRPLTLLARGHPPFRPPAA